MPDLQANIYVAADGIANYDVLALPSDTTAEDTTTMALPFEQIKVGELAISAKSLGYESLLTPSPPHSGVHLSSPT